MFCSMGMCSTCKAFTWHRVPWTTYDKSFNQKKSKCGCVLIMMKWSAIETIFFFYFINTYLSRQILHDAKHYLDLVIGFRIDAQSLFNNNSTKLCMRLAVNKIENNKKFSRLPWLDLRGITKQLFDFVVRRCVLFRFTERVKLWIGCLSLSPLPLLWARFSLTNDESHIVDWTRFKPIFLLME